MTRSVQLASLSLFALIGGFFYAFSVCVMPGLDRSSPETAIEAMQKINEAVRNPVFFVTFFLTPVAGGAAAMLLLISGLRTAAIWMGIASAIYLLGAFVPTVAINVPMNEALAAFDIAGPDGGAQTVWQEYSSRWTFWNTVRTGFSTLAVMAAGMALVSSARK